MILLGVVGWPSNSQLLRIWDGSPPHGTQANRGGKDALAECPSARSRKMQASAFSLFSGVEFFVY